MTGALKTIMELKDFCYIWAPLTLIFVHRKLLKHGYYEKIKIKDKLRVSVLKVLVAAAIVLGFFVSTLTGTDISRLYKQWNREYVVMKFGIYVYQGNDLIASLKPQISPLFGYDTAANTFEIIMQKIPMKMLPTNIRIYLKIKMSLLFMPKACKIIC